jgi:nicotinate (nicotinamide) nucleotide adenylyltransferase
MSEKGISVASPTKKIRTSEAASTRKRIAVYGGSFDPITNGHLNIAAEIIHLGKADEVWITPCGPRPDKPSLRTPAIQRWLLCHLALNTTFGSRFPIKICDSEVHEEMALDSYDLIKKLEKEYPYYDFFFALGSDLIPTLDQWTPINETTGKSKIWEEVNFLGLPRPGYALAKDVVQPPSIVWLTDDHIEGVNLVTAETSSSEIRKRLKTFGDCREHRNLTCVEGLIPSAVVAHIIRNGLYLDE